MEGNKLQLILTQFRAFVAQQGWSIVAEKPIDYGYQLTISDQESKIAAAFYTSGKALIQGKDTSALRSQLQAWCSQHCTPNKTKAVAKTPTPASLFPDITVASPPASKILGIARIGSDESGKGDYFGPLVTAAVYVDKSSEAFLVELGVRDSKQLSDTKMSVMAREITRKCPFKVLTYTPEVYNEMYRSTPNVNTLLANAHARVIQPLSQQTASPLAIVDQFGDESLVRLALQKAGSTIALEQRHRAEEDTAVAAASIVARAKFVQQMQMLSDMVGVTLPKGGSNPTIIDVGREIVRRHGQAGLQKVAKLHFRTTTIILNNE